MPGNVQYYVMNSVFNQCEKYTKNENGDLVDHKTYFYSILDILPREFTSFACWMSVINILDS